MPHYFFHTTNGSPHRDEDGMDLPDIDAARREAVRYGGSLISDDPDMIIREKGIRIDLVDDGGEHRLTVRIVIEG
ncbi:MAG TPA: hypothetical protein VN047_09710 [Sphingopyxis sp.]|uniref:DUF6894 family protein n=1 Tax=Sphingopyxis sp. TaxID=1908224 RepID=UPI002C150492|nr:hypothetical protein [Sphingopyxis sp.]HWW57154.1 hypothetical protein [Sphingopyxis sp.]